MAKGSKKEKKEKKVKKIKKKHFIDTDIEEDESDFVVPREDVDFSDDAFLELRSDDDDDDF